MIEKTAFSLGRNDEEPNIRLAVQLCAAQDQKGIREIVAGWRENDFSVPGIDPVNPV